MGPRKLIKEGALTKAKSGRKLYGFLCSDILVLTDESMKTLYRMVSWPFSNILRADPQLFIAYPPRSSSSQRG